MRFKEKAVEALHKAADQEMGPARNVIKECVELVANLPEDKLENVECAKPNYEAMYHEEHKKVQEMLKIQNSMEAEIRCWQSANARLSGFKEAIEMVYGKGYDCHGHC